MGEHNRYGASRTAATAASQLVPTPRRSSSAATSTNGAPWAMLPSRYVDKHLAMPPSIRLASGRRSTLLLESLTPAMVRVGSNVASPDRFRPMVATMYGCMARPPQ